MAEWRSPREECGKPQVADSQLLAFPAVDASLPVVPCLHFVPSLPVVTVIPFLPLLPFVLVIPFPPVVPLVPVVPAVSVEPFVQLLLFAHFLPSLPFVAFLLCQAVQWWFSILLCCTMSSCYY